MLEYKHLCYTCFTIEEYEIKTVMSDETEFVDEQEQEPQQKCSNSSEDTKTTSHSPLKRQEHVVYPRPISYSKGNMPTNITNYTSGIFSGLSEKKEMVIRGTQSLPRIYNLTINPSLDESTEAWR